VFLVDIENVGAWVLKFRKTGVIINNRYDIPFKPRAGIV
jgi:hypothetical protein